MRTEFETRQSSLEPVDWRAVEAAIARARRLRAEAVAGHLRRAARTLRRWVAPLLGSVARARRQRADTHALMALDDRMLADIGLTRSDVRAAVYGGAPLRALRQHTVGAGAEVHPLPLRDRRAGVGEGPFERAA